MKRMLCILMTLILIITIGYSEETIGKVECQEESNVTNNHRVFYEIFVGSFSDSNGDGIGDLRGVINRMDYLNDGNPSSGNSLGIEGIWLTPIFLSPSYHKYDVSDYYQIDPSFGTKEDLQELITLCHERNVKLILDMPLNHTSLNNRWFRSFINAHLTHNPDSIWYNYYSWLEPYDSVPADKHYIRVTFSHQQQTDLQLQVEANFSDSMPELNFDNEIVRKNVLDVATYWLQFGVDGFRFDAAKYPYFGNHDKNVEFWTWYMTELKKIKPDIYTVGEVWDGDNITDRYLDAFNCFRFSTAQAEGLIARTARGGNVNRFTQAIQDYLDSIHEKNPDAMNIPFVANHDTDRAAGYLTVSSGKMQMAANLYVLMPGSPFIYYGEEIGLRGSRGAANTDANRRLAMLWGDGDTVNDPEGSTYDNQTPSSVKDLNDEAGSILNHYRKVIAIRKANPEIAYGDYIALSFANTKVGGFLCTWNGSTIGVFHNTTDKEQTVDLSEATELRFVEITASLSVDPYECIAELDGSLLTIGPQTSIILK